MAHGERGATQSCSSTTDTTDTTELGEAWPWEGEWTEGAPPREGTAHGAGAEDPEGVYTLSQD